MNNITYLDTSGLNYLADTISDYDLFKLWKDSLKIDFCISAAVLWEVLLNSNDQRKENLIYWAQFNCADYLLKSPSELFVSYLEKSCPKKDKKQFWYDRKTKLDIGNTWKIIHGDIKKTIPIDLEGLKERTQPIREFSKKLKTMLDDMCDKESSRYVDDTFHDAMHKTLNSLKRSTEISIRDEKSIKLSLIFTFFFVCVGLELDNSPISNYWNQIEIDDPFERLYWIIENNPEIVIRGPIVEMVRMAEAQFNSSNPKSRGLIHDCLHSVYCYYVDNIVTGDEHFKCLREKEDHQIYKGIIMVDDFNKLWQMTAKKLTMLSTRTKTRPGFL